jgi:UDP-hydrolysing UDP-N-acetyl-D-glucosamine 2-epimerase
MDKRKIAVVTGSRAEYGLLFLIMKAIQNDPALELQVIVTGMHLSPEFGSTYKFIEQDGFTIDAKVEMLLSSDSASGIAKSMGLCLISMTDALHKLNPDMIVLLGDRFETLAVTQAALVQRIPVAHVHGGELSEGAIDDAIRHAITKMSHLHFVAADSYRQRVIQLGENPATVFNFGAPGLEHMSTMELRSRAALEGILQRSLDKKNFLITYHPATLALESTVQAVKNLFASLDKFPEANVIFTKANADESGRVINRMVDEYAAAHPERVSAHTSLGNLNYLSLMQYADVLIGNSSSAIIEAPFFRKATVNIGTRQNKRLHAETIINCDEDAASITAAISKALSPEFQASLATAKLLYSKDETASKIKDVLKKVDLKKLIVKQFYDLEKA